MYINFNTAQWQNKCMCCVCRPLPDEMLKYAQADTHYLLYVYDRVRADLFDGGNEQPTLIQQVWAKSRDLSLKVWTRFNIDLKCFSWYYSSCNIHETEKIISNAFSIKFYYFLYIYFV